MKITLLGTGTSQGVPVIACDCEVCTSADPRDNRLRCSVLIETGTENYVIDAGPDFRQQMLRANVKSLNGVLFTHEHKDHLAGLDDVRAFNHKEKRPMEIYCTIEVDIALKREFHYVFFNETYPGIPKLNVNLLDGTPFKLPDGTAVTPIRVLHYKMPVLGFRIRDFVYITDAKTVSEDERKKIRGCDILVINCLHEFPHISHFNLEEALAFIEDIQPKKAYLTHISHYFGKHSEIEQKLPENVWPAYDGQEFEI
ncbi:MAG: fold metallo-hydrolase [Crocinitomicaceae bacterium]|nr:fold metallo-hydrolase [Crocinitomicaceae bacterium]